MFTMSLFEIMERVGSRQTNRVKAYIKAGLIEMQSIIPEKTTGQKYNVVSDQRLYSLPTNMIRLLDVYAKYDDNGRYIRIPMINNMDIIEDASSTAADSETDIIVV